jgi:hypothetical protein
LDNIIKLDMIITTQKYQTINITKLINTLNLNFIILNNKLIFTHKLTTNNLKDINKLLKNKYNSCYKIYKQ